MKCLQTVSLLCLVSLAQGVLADEPIDPFTSGAYNIQNPVQYYQFMGEKELLKQEQRDRTYSVLSPNEYLASLNRPTTDSQISSNSETETNTNTQTTTLVSEEFEPSVELEKPYWVKAAQHNLMNVPDEYVSNDFIRAEWARVEPKIESILSKEQELDELLNYFNRLKRVVKHDQQQTAPLTYNATPSRPPQPKNRPECANPAIRDYVIPKCSHESLVESD